MTSYLDGVAVLKKRLEALDQVAQIKILRSAVRTGIKPAKQRAQELIPVGIDAHRTYKGRLVAPGFAKRSIRTITVVRSDKKAVSALLGVRKEAFYAVTFVEVGTSKMPAKAWLRPAMKGTQSEQEAGVAIQLKKQVDKATRA